MKKTIKAKRIKEDEVGFFKYGKIYEFEEAGVSFLDLKLLSTLSERGRIYISPIVVNDYFDIVENEKNEQPKEQPQSFGDVLVGRKFNPSNDSIVDKLKYHFSEIANIINEHSENNELDSKDKNKGIISSSIYLSCISDILKAQMMSVKFVTLNK